MKFTFTRAELAEHLGGKISRDEQRIALTEREMESMQALRDESAVPAATKSGHENPVEGLRARLDQYRQRLKRWRLLLDHLPATETFELGVADLALLGYDVGRHYEYE